MFAGAGAGVALVAGAIVWLALPKDIPPAPPARQVTLTQPAAPVILPPPAVVPVVAPPIAKPVLAPAPVVAASIPVTPAPPVLVSASVSPPVIAPVVEALNRPPPLPPKRSAGVIEAALTSSLSGVKCSLAREVTSGDGAVTVTGIAGAGQPEEAARRAVASADPASTTLRLKSFNGPFCAVLDLLRPVGGVAAGSIASMEIDQAGGPAGLRDNDVISLRVTMPGFPGYLHVAYLQSDSVVSPLVPGDGYPARTFAPRAQVELGKPRADFVGWHVGPPFGADMIVAIASTAPLFAKALPASQPLAGYLAGLQAAMDDLIRRGGTVAASAIILDTSVGG